MAVEAPSLWQLLSRHSFALIAPERQECLPSAIGVMDLAEGPLADSAAFTPGMVVLGELSSPQREELCRLIDAEMHDGTGPSVCALLQTEDTCAAEQLKRHLSIAQVRHGPRGAQAWLRLHDARVWRQLPRVLSPQSLRWLFGPITTWTVCFNGEWTTAHRPAVELPVLGNRSDALEWAALSRLGPINRALAALRMSSPEDVDANSARLDELVARAQERHGLTHPGDLAAYACFGHEVHPRFDEHPIVVTAIADCDPNSPDANIIDVLATIGHVQRQLIRQDLNSNNPKGMEDEQRQAV